MFILNILMSLLQYICYGILTEKCFRSTRRGKQAAEVEWH